MKNERKKNVFQRFSIYNNFKSQFNFSLFYLANLTLKVKKLENKKFILKNF